MEKYQLHPAQVAILRVLRHSESARYSDLQRPTEMESDGFKFHLRKLVQHAYVEKLADGHYQLTPAGKEFANNLDRRERAVQKQPKLSVMIMASRSPDGSEEQFLLQQRARNPFWGYWGALSGPIQWGEEPEATAQREFEKQTGLAATYAVKSFLRKRNYSTDGKTLFEDKQFIIVEAANVKGELLNTWAGGFNQWMTLSELQNQNRYFEDTLEVVEMLKRNQTYASISVTHDADKY